MTFAIPVPVRLLFIAGFLPVALAAQTVVQTLTFDSDDFSAPISATTAYTPVFSGTINQFDAGLGTLNSVTLAFSFTFTSSTPVGAGGGGAGLSGSGTVYWNDIVLGGGGNSNGSGGPPFSTVVVTLPIADDDLVQNLTLEEATGPGTATFTYDGSLTVATNSSVQLDSGTLQLTYHYTAAAIPEPSTWAMLAGVTALVLAGWRRRARDVG